MAISYIRKFNFIQVNIKVISCHLQIDDQTHRYLLYKVNVFMQVQVTALIYNLNS